jgi:hypothetical protein
LPTTAPTRWRLDPDWYTTSAGNDVYNRRAVLVVDVPALTDLTLSYTSKGQTPQHTDNGETRRWFITVGTNHCDDPVTFHVVDVGRKRRPDLLCQHRTIDILASRRQRKFDLSVGTATLQDLREVPGISRRDADLQLLRSLLFELADRSNGSRRWLPDHSGQRAIAVQVAVSRQGDPSHRDGIP